MEASRKVTEETQNDGAEEITRESVMEEQGWDEASVVAVDGFSEVLDKYVETQNAAYGPEELGGEKEECIVWIDAKSHKIIQSQYTVHFSNENKNDLYAAAYEAEKAFYKDDWKVSVFKNNTDQGISPEVTKQEIKDMQQQMDEDFEQNWSDENMLDLGPSQEKYTTTEKYSYGKDCPQMEELPKEYKEVTRQEYWDMMNAEAKAESLKGLRF